MREDPAFTGAQAAPTSGKDGGRQTALKTFFRSKVPQTAHKRETSKTCLLYNTPSDSQPTQHCQLPGCLVSAMGYSYLVQVRCLGGCRRTVDAPPGGVPPPLCSFCAEEEGKAAEVHQH